MKVLLLAKATQAGAIANFERAKMPTKQAIMAMHNFNEELQKAGVLLDLGGLTPTSQGARLKYRGSQLTLIDGPFTEAKELIAGYSLLEVKSFAEAIEWARRAPFGVGVAEGEEGEVELRPLFDPSNFDPGKGV